jgi:hypothetical protein
VAFTCVGKDELKTIDRYRELQHQSIHVFYDAKLELFIIKLMLGPLHEHAILSFSQEMLLNMIGQNLCPFAYEPMGATRHGDPSRAQKEVDDAFKPGTV